MKRFKEKTVIITGAGSDIGHATALRLAKEGANVVLVGRSKDKLAETTELFPQDHTWIHGHNHLTITCDITQPLQVEKMMEHVSKKFSGVDVVVNTVGFAAQISMAKMTDKQLLSAMRALQKDALRFCYAVAPKLEQSHGNIINVLTCPNNLKPDRQDLHDEVNREGYALTQKLAIEYASKNIRVNSIDSSVVAIGNNSKPCLLNRLPTEEDIAAAIAFLASSDAAMITGIVLPVDAGMNALNQQI